jgi:hypothetical protein
MADDERDRDRVRDRDRDRDRDRAPAADEVRARQRDEYGGINWGAAFFGWLVAVGLGSLLVGIVAAAGLALFYLSQSSQVVATGYEIDGLHALLAERRAEQQQLMMQIGNARSPAEIARRAQAELQLVPLAEGAVRFAPAATTIAD